MSKTMTLLPRISEKAFDHSQAKNVYVFVVPGEANKATVAQAVEAQFEVTVTDINLLNVKGKSKRSIRRGGRATMGKRSDVKKAYVSLKEGDSIPVFASEETESKPTKTTKKEKK